MQLETRAPAHRSLSVLGKFIKHLVEFPSHVVAYWNHCTVDETNAHALSKTLDAHEGARYYEPRLSLWISCDPKQGKYPYFTTYCYALNNPIKFVDPDGEDVFVYS